MRNHNFTRDLDELKSLNESDFLCEFKNIPLHLVSVYNMLQIFRTEEVHTSVQIFRNASETFPTSVYEDFFFFCKIGVRFVYVATN